LCKKYPNFTDFNAREYVPYPDGLSWNDEQTSLPAFAQMLA